MAGEGDFCGLAIFPLIIFIFFVSAIAKATRMGGLGMTGRTGYGGSYNSYGSSYNTGHNRSYGGHRNNNFVAMQYLGNTPSSNYRPYSPPPSYPGYSSPQPAYGGVPTTGYAPVPPPGYPGTAPPSTGYGGAPSGYPSAYSPPQSVIKVSCSYCGSLNPNTERNCLLCGAPMR